MTDRHDTRGQALTAALVRRSLATRLGLAVASVAALTLATAFVTLAWLASLAGAGAAPGCNTTAPVQSRAVPVELAPIFTAAADHYALGPNGAAILAGLTSVESDFGRSMGPSSAGAIGFTQFLPDTWRKYGVDANADGHLDPYDPADAIYSTANYLRASGAPADWHRALLTYNHADWYVQRVLDRAATYGATSADAALPNAGCATASPPEGAQRIQGGGRIVPIPGSPGQRIDERLLGDIAYLAAIYHVTVTAGYAPIGHAPGGEHPLGLAVDLIPGPGGTWDDIDRLAAWAEPSQNHPRPPFRWVGYTGDPGHGRGNHLHLSWQHGPTPNRKPPAPWVLTLGTTTTP